MALPEFKIWHLVVLVATASVGGLWWWMKPPSHPAAKDPALLPGGAAVFHTPGTRVSFFGIENLHAFDIRKYDRIAAQLVTGGHVPAGGFGVAKEVTDAELAQVHDEAYIASLHEMGVLSRALEVSVPGVFGPFADRRVLAPFRRATGATVAATRHAVERGVGINIGGGYHHARPAMGHGFCIYGDVALAIHEVRKDGFTKPILIVDTDAHQGDGNNAFFAADPSVITFSMHGAALFPHPKVPGDVDVPLAAGIKDSAFLERLEAELRPIFESAKPGLVVHVAGADVLHDDPLADLSLTIDGLVERDRLVARLAREHDAALVHTLAGGYGPSAAEAQARALAAILGDLASPTDP